MLRNKSPQEDLQKQHDAKNRLHFYQMQRRQFFEHLDDEPSLDPEWMDTTRKKPANKSPTTTWSVSDLTSDTHSIKESLPMVRIDEESALEVYEEVNVCEGSKSQPHQDEHLASHHLHFLSRWNKQSDGSEIGSYPDCTKTRLHNDSVYDEESSAVLSEETSGRYDFRDILQVISDRSTSNPKRIEECDAIPNDSMEFSTVKKSCSYMAKDHHSKRKSKEGSVNDILPSITHPTPCFYSGSGRDKKKVTSLSWIQSDRQLKIDYETPAKGIAAASKASAATSETAMTKNERNHTIGTGNITDSSINTDLSSVPEEQENTTSLPCEMDESNDEKTTTSDASVLNLKNKSEEKDRIYINYSDIQFFLYNLWLQSVISKLKQSKHQKLISF
jgi:hypothetical protein